MLDITEVTRIFCTDARRVGLELSEDIDKVFTNDSKSKKRTANGSFGRVRDLSWEI